MMSMKEKVAQMRQYAGLKHMRDSEKSMTAEEPAKSHAHGFYKNPHSSQVAEMTARGMAGSSLHVADLEKAPPSFRDFPLTS